MKLFLSLAITMKVMSYFEADNCKSRTCVNNSFEQILLLGWKVVIAVKIIPTSSKWLQPRKE